MLSIPPGAIQRLVTEATIVELAACWPTVETEGFVCPVCTKGRNRWAPTPLASVDSDITWSCHGAMIIPKLVCEPVRRVNCAGGTIWTLRRLVLDDRRTLETFLELAERGR